ncbi:MAG TPA: alkaline phosphatase family protein [Candidatus Nitrosotalea sp.]|nr:alkaline phosphatase family protein [Candidatus Nitrosotalea sp.]
MTRALLAAAAAGFGIVSCSANSANPPVSSSAARIAQSATQLRHKTSQPIQHVIVLIQENRSFDDFFADYPGADGATQGKMKGPHGDKTIKLHEANLVEPCDFGHSYNGFLKDYDGGKMDGFNGESVGAQCTGLSQRRPYQYVNPTQIAPYWDIAEQYVLADHMFQTQGSGSYTAHQDLIRGGTTIDQNQVESIVDDPSSSPWGCDAQVGTTVPLLEWQGGKLHRATGPYPCTNAFPSSGSYYATMRDLLDAKSVSWKYYSPPVKNGVGKYWNAFDTIASVRFGPEWGTNVTTSEPFEKGIFNDISAGTLPAVSWVIPDDGNSDHPGVASDRGPGWIASVVNAIGESSYWDSTAVIVVWDDWGGFYDHEPPPLTDHWGGLGFRVPMLLVSAYAKLGTESRGGYISHTQYEFGSILHFIEDTFSLGSLGTTDQRAASIADSLDFSQPPRSFTAIPSSYSRAYFLHQRESYRPIDTQ